jgi:hypothetical protein
MAFATNTTIMLIAAFVQECFYRITYFQPVQFKFSLSFSSTTERGQLTQWWLPARLLTVNPTLNSK